MLEPSAGAGRICGFSLRRDAREIRRSTGILFGLQSGLYERLSAKENIGYFARLNGIQKEVFDTRLKEISALLDMSEFLDRRSSDFSTGMRQKTLIARAIIHRPKLLLLDEPTNGLDLRASENIFQFIKTYAEGGGTVLFSSHQIEAVSALSDRVAVLHKGELNSFLPPHEFPGGLGNYMSNLLQAS
jgi:sodium transport system ATP-binding protein